MCEQSKTHFIDVTDALDEVTLTASYADNRFTIDMRRPVTSGQEQLFDKANEFNYLTLMFEYQVGTGETNNILQIQIENGPSDDDLYISTAATVSSGVVTLEAMNFQFTGANATAPYKYAFPVEISDRVLRISVAESGVVTNFGTVSIKAFLSKR